ncbi:MAG: 2-oxo acid dehydrogenase subunit E2, partial [Anaerolineales bacterium]
MKATLSVDHRVSDGAEGARFMQALPKKSGRCGEVFGRAIEAASVRSTRLSAIA